jgi:hypothetical protein
MLALASCTNPMLGLLSVQKSWGNSFGSKNRQALLLGHDSCLYRGKGSSKIIELI